MNLFTKGIDPLHIIEGTTDTAMYSRIQEKISVLSIKELKTPDVSL